MDILVVLLIAASLTLIQSRVTFTYSEVLQEADLDESNTAKFKCDIGCNVYSSSQDANMWITDGTRDVQNFALMGKPDKPTELVNWTDYKLQWRGAGAAPEFVFYAVDKEAPNLDTPVRVAGGESSFGFTGGSTSSRRFTLLGNSDLTPTLSFDGEFADGYPRVYATGYDAISEDACKPVYQARSQNSAVNSQLTIASPILTVDKGPAKAAVQAETNYALKKKTSESSVVFKSPGYVGCSYIKDQIYSSASDVVLDSFSTDAKTIYFTADLHIPTADEAVHITVNDAKVVLHGTTPSRGHFEASDGFDVTVSWTGDAASSFTVQFDLSGPGNGVAEMINRPVLNLLVFTAVASGQKAALDKKVTTLISTYLGANEPKATDIIADCLVKQQTFAQIKDALSNKLVSLIPAGKATTAMAMLSTWDSCLKKAGSSMDEALAAVSAVFGKVLNTPYANIIKKMKEMSKAKKTTAQMTNQAYTIAGKALTKKLVQNLINTLKAGSTAAQWNCSLPPLNAIILTSQYNMKKG